MPGYEYNRSKNSLGFGARAPLPDNTPSTGPLSPHLMAQASRHQAMMAQISIPKPTQPIVPNASLRRPGEGFVGDEYRQLHPTGGMDSSPGHPGFYGISGAEMYAQGLHSAADRQQLEFNLDNEQVNHRLGMKAAMAGRPAPPFQQYVGGSDARAPGPAANYARAFPSSTRSDPMVDALRSGAGIMGTAPRAGAFAGNPAPYQTWTSPAGRFAPGAKPEPYYPMLRPRFDPDPAAPRAQMAGIPGPGAITGTAAGNPEAVGGEIARMLAQARGGQPPSPTIRTAMGPTPFSRDPIGPPADMGPLSVPTPPTISPAILDQLRQSAASPVPEAPAMPPGPVPAGLPRMARHIDATQRPGGMANPIAQALMAPGRPAAAPRGPGAEADPLMASVSRQAEHLRSGNWAGAEAEAAIQAGMKQKAEMERLAAETAGQRSRNAIGKWTEGMSPVVSATYERMIRGEISPAEFYRVEAEDKARRAVPTPSNPVPAPRPGAPVVMPPGPLPNPTTFESRTRLQELMPDLPEIAPDPSAGAFDAFQRAMDRGYGSKGLSDPNSELSRAFREHLKSFIGPDAWRMGLLPSGNQSWWDWATGSMPEQDPRVDQFRNWGDGIHLPVPSPPRVRVPSRASTPTPQTFVQPTDPNARFWVNFLAPLGL